MTITMNTYLTKIINACLIIAATAFCSCNDNDIAEEATKTVKIRSCNIDCSVTDDATTRATEQHQWKDGDKLLVNFRYSTDKYSTSGEIGIATFNNSIWTMKLIKDSETIPVKTNGTCDIAYIAGDYTLSSGSVYIPKDCPIYKSTGTYTFTSKGDLSIKATLDPEVCRFRIKGSQNETFEIKGIYFPYRFNIYSIPYDFSSVASTRPDKESMDSKTLVCSIEENGAYYTPYIYGYVIQNLVSYSHIKIKKGSKVFALRNNYYLDLFRERSVVFDATSGFIGKN